MFVFDKYSLIIILYLLITETEFINGFNKKKKWNSLSYEHVNLHEIKMFILKDL